MIYKQIRRINSSESEKFYLESDNTNINQYYNLYNIESVKDFIKQAEEKGLTHIGIYNQGFWIDKLVAVEAEVETEAEAIERKAEVDRKYAEYVAQEQAEQDRKEYERLKAKFENGK